MNRPNIGRVAARWWPIGAALLVVAVAVGIAAGNKRDERLRAQAGDIVRTELGTVQVDEAEIRLPIGAVRVEATAPVGESSQLGGRDAPENGSWVGIKVASMVDKRLPQPADASQDDRPDPRIVIELIAGGRTYPVPVDTLDPPPRTLPALEREAWVAVAGRSDDIRIAITYDGVKQSVRPSNGTRTTGRAAPLYKLAYAPQSRVEAPSCGSPRYPAAYGPESGDFAPSCRVTQYPLLPYVPRLGWAPSSSRWLVLAVEQENYLSVRWRGQGGDGVVYRDEQTPALQVALDGAPAVANNATSPTLVKGVSVSPTYLAIFEVPATATSHRLTITTSWRDLDTGDGPPPTGAPVAPDIALTWTKDLR